jgi:hypothetical protein
MARPAATCVPPPQPRSAAAVASAAPTPFLSQVPECVADAVRDHLLYDCAQLDAGYDVSNRHAPRSIQWIGIAQAVWVGASQPGPEACDALCWAPPLPCAQRGL